MSQAHEEMKPTEADRLRALLDARKINRAKFARETGFPGGDSMIGQHLSGHRPISLDAGLAYARGLAVPLKEISPRLHATLLEAIRIGAIPGFGGSDDCTSSQVYPKVRPEHLSWEFLLSLPSSDFLDLFSVAVPDDALAPDTPAGTKLFFSTTASPSPGSGVIVATRDGGRYLRRYVVAAGGRWLAQARNDAYPTFDSERDGLTVLAVALERSFPSGQV